MFRLLTMKKHTYFINTLNNYSYKKNLYLIFLISPFALNYLRSATLVLHNVYLFPTFFLLTPAIFVSFLVVNYYRILSYYHRCIKMSIIGQILEQSICIGNRIVTYLGGLEGAIAPGVIFLGEASDFYIDHLLMNNNINWLIFFFSIVFQDCNNLHHGYRQDL